MTSWLPHRLLLAFWFAFAMAGPAMAAGGATHQELAIDGASSHVAIDDGLALDKPLVMEWVIEFNSMIRRPWPPSAKPSPHRPHAESARRLDGSSRLDLVLDPGQAPGGISIFHLGAEAR